MKSNAGKAVRKWAFWRWDLGQGAAAAMLAVLLIAATPAQSYLTAGRVPLPMPR